MRAILFLLIACRTILSGQLSVGAEYGFAFSKSRGPSESYKNLSYEVKSLRRPQFEFHLKYQFRKWSATLASGAIALGFLQRYSQGVTPHPFYTGYPPGLPIHFYDFHICGYHYLKTGSEYHFTKKLTAGCSLYFLWQKAGYDLVGGDNRWFKTDDYTLFEREVYVIGYAGRTKWVEYHDFREYDLKRHSLAAAVSLSYSIHAGFKFRLEYLRGLQPYFQDLQKVKFYHRALSVGIGYEYTFNKKIATKPGK